MQFVDEFRDPELAKSLLQRLQKVMETNRTLHQKIRYI